MFITVLSLISLTDPPLRLPQPVQSSPILSCTQYLTLPTSIGLFGSQQPSNLPHLTIRYPCTIRCYPNVNQISPRVPAHYTLPSFGEVLPLMRLQQSEIFSGALETFSSGSHVILCAGYPFHTIKYSIFVRLARRCFLWLMISSTSYSGSPLAEMMGSGFVYILSASSGFLYNFNFEMWNTRWIFICGDKSNLQAHVYFSKILNGPQ